MGRMRAFTAPTKRQIESRDYTKFVDKLKQATQNSYSPIGQGLLLDLQRENRENRDGLYLFYRRIMAIENTVELMGSTFETEMKKARLRDSMESVYSAKTGDNLNSNNLYHKAVLSERGFFDIGKLVCELAQTSNSLSTLRQELGLSL